MGSSRWSDGDYYSRASLRAKTNTPVFAYTSAIASGATPAAVHASLDPLRTAGPSSPLAGQNIRECRDSDAHPNSTGICVLMDVTGSMGEVPKTLQGALVTLMGLLLRKNYVPDPSILIGGIGDAYVDRSPVQLGQFESGIEIENDLTNLYLEGGGGGQRRESYELGLYFLARKTALDCVEKRKKRGYAFIIGDEMAYANVCRHQVKKYFGDSLEADIDLEVILKEVQEKFELFYILPNLTSYYNEPEIIDFWKSHLGQNFIRLDDPKGVSELIATLIGVNEGTVSNVEDDLKEAGTDLAVRNAVNSAIAPVAKAKGDIATLAGTGLNAF